MKKLTKDEMKKVMGGVATTQCNLVGNSSCQSPTGGAYGGWTTCYGTPDWCQSQGDTACSTDDCCDNWDCVGAN